ncbi:MAG: MerR family transcriptional regulator [Solirubrobacteraceae bacterium]|nr:MerR family transcriptional regulator [Solirubrobacteraceae bacterium]
MSGPTLSASEFAAVTGMTRDRLRTWERRHGWPHPVRSEGGARRYLTDDAVRVVAVRRLHESGMPLERAIAQHTGGALRSLAASTWRGLVDELPMPVVILSGPVPLTVVHANAVVRERPGGPQTGDVLEDIAAWFAADPAYDRLAEVFTTDERVAVCTHPDWTGGMTRPTRSMAVRMPQRPGTLPLVALVGIDTSVNRQAQAEVGRIRLEREILSERTTRLEAWAATAAEITKLVTTGSVRALRTGMHALRKQTDASDTACYLVADGEIRLVTSLRGRFAPLPDALSDDLRAALADAREPRWLRAEDAAGLGAPVTCGVTLLGTAVLGGDARMVIALASLEPLALERAEQELLEVSVAQLARHVPWISAD